MRVCFQFIVGFAGFLAAALGAWAQPSPELAEALQAFRTEGPKGWAFTQTSHSPDRSRVETFDPLRPAHLQWTLVTENGETPSDRVLEAYRQQQTRRTGGRTAPNVKEQLIMASAELIAQDADREQWRFLLQPGADDDASAEHMATTITFHPATRTIERIELASFEPFSPMFGVNIESARTRIEYSLPVGEVPSLLQHIEVSVRGRAFYLKSLDSDMTVSYSDYNYRGRAPVIPRSDSP